VVDSKIKPDVEAAFHIGACSDTTETNTEHLRKNNIGIDVNAGDFDSTFVIPEGFKQEEIVPPAPPTTTKQPISSTGAVPPTGGTVGLDSEFAADTLFGNDALAKAIFKQGNL